MATKKWLHDTSHKSIKTETEGPQRDTKRNKTTKNTYVPVTKRCKTATEAHNCDKDIQNKHKNITTKRCKATTNRHKTTTESL